MKRTGKSQPNCEQKTQIAKTGGMVPQDAKEVMAELVAKLSEKLELQPDKEERGKGAASGHVSPTETG